MKAPNGKPTNLTERQWLHVRTKNFKKWFGDWEKLAKFVASFDKQYINLNIKRNEYTNDFRRIQRESLGLSEESKRKYHHGTFTDSEGNELQSFGDEDRRRLGNVYGRLLSGSNHSRKIGWTHLTGKGNTFKITRVNGSLFHDIFEINRNYLQNGELVDLHDDYENCKCFLSDDGLCGFAIEPDGNLVSLFSLNPEEKKGFLYAIRDFVVEQGATHLDAYASTKQDLEAIYLKTLGFRTVASMDYNMEYDHDDIAKNHGTPNVVFMVKADKAVERKHFDKDSYEEAQAYQKKLLNDNYGNVSKVVDENGEPLVVYHGSPNKFTVFNTKSTIGAGSYFFKDKKYAEKYLNETEDSNIYSVFLNIKNLKSFSQNELKEITERNGRKVLKETVFHLLYEDDVNNFIDNGFDGLSAAPNGLTQYVIFNPNQAKSATDNNGEYSQENNDMQMFVVGEKGAKSMDEAEEVTTRMDNLSVANDMEKAGKDALTIKVATGWERGADGKWRYEIPDVKLKKKTSLAWIKIRGIVGSNKNHYTTRDLSEVVDLSSLPQIYREELEARGELRVYYDNTDSLAGSFVYDDGKIIITLNLALRRFSKSIESTLSHEIQHYIQDREGFASGGNLDTAKSVQLSQSEEYRQLRMQLGEYERVLNTILKSDEKYQKYRRIATKLILLSATMPEEIEISRQKRSEYIKKRIPEWEIDVDYAKHAKNRMDELKAGHREILAEAKKKDIETQNKLKEIEAALPDAYETYRRFAGEVESRTVQKRIGLTAEERRNSLFTDDMYKDVAKEDLIFMQEGLENSIAESRKHSPRHTKNDVSAFHLSRSYYEVTNDIFKIQSERKYKREIQSHIKNLPSDTDRTNGLWYLSKDEKRAFKINTSVENFEENKGETGYGFEVVDWYNIEKLDSEKKIEFLNIFTNDENRGNISSLLQRIENKQRSDANSDGLLSDRETAINNAGLDLQASSGESIGGRAFGDSRSNQGASAVEEYFMTPQGEIYGFVSKNGDIYLDENIITPEHPIHEFTHFWDRIVKQKNPRLWQRGVVSAPLRTSPIRCYSHFRAVALRGNEI